MVAYEIIGSIGEAAYEYVNDFRGWLLSKFTKKYVPKKQLDTANDKVEKLKEELNEKREATTRNQDNFDEVSKKLESLKTEKHLNEKKLDEFQNKIGKLQDSIDKHEAELHKFKILYAAYGVEGKFVEVTKIVSDLFSSRNKFQAQNDILGGVDPLKFMVKKLKIEYQFNNEKREVLALENEELELKDNTIQISETEESKKVREWEVNKMKLGEVFNGVWELSISKNGKSIGKEILKIDQYGKYYINNQHYFDLLVLEVNDKNINFLKINLQTREHHSQEKLRIDERGLIKGNDDLGNDLEYKRQPRITTIQV